MTLYTGAYFLSWSWREVMICFWNSEWYASRQDFLVLNMQWATEIKVIDDRGSVVVEIGKISRTKVECFLTGLEGKFLVRNLICNISVVGVSNKTDNAASGLPTPKT